MLRVLTVLAFATLLTDCSNKSSSEIASTGIDSLSSSGDVDPNNSVEVTLPGLFKFLETGKPTIPSAFLPLLHLDSAYESLIQLNSSFEDKQLLVVRRPKGGCTPINCQHGIKAYVFDRDRNLIVDSNEIDYVLQSEPKFAFEHDMFLLVTDVVKDYKENENDVMEATSEPYDVDYLVIYFENAFLPAAGYSKEKLRIIRNYIFAGYGYKFTSPDLQDYFKQFTWYKPLNSNVDDQLTENDKKIIKVIAAIEKK